MESRFLTIAVGVICLGISMFLYINNTEVEPEPVPFSPEVIVPPAPTPDPKLKVGLVKATNDEDLERLLKLNEKNRAILISGDWCPMCRTLKREGVLKEIERNFPDLLVIEADLRSLQFRKSLNKIAEAETSGKLKPFSRRSATKFFPSMLYKNTIFTGLNEITVKNLRSVVD